MDIKGHHVAASEDNPEYLVKSDKTGKEAAHKPDELNKGERCGKQDKDFRARGAPDHGRIPAGATGDIGGV